MNISLKSLNKCDWYIVIWFLYQTQGLFYPEGVINQLLQMVLISIALVEATQYILPQRQHPNFLHATTILLAMFVVYGTIYILLGQGDRLFVYMKTALTSFLPFFLFYKYAKEGYLTESRMRIYFFVFLLVTLWHYYNAALQHSSESTETTNNTGYEFLRLIPLTFFFYKKPMLQYLLVGIAVIFILMSMKRGAIMIGLLCLFWLLWENVKHADSRKKFITIALGCVICAVLAYAVMYMMSNSDYFMQRLHETEQGNSSGRNRLYDYAIEYLATDTSWAHLWFGGGASYTLNVLGKFAHNDWLEIAINNGFLGISLFVNYCVSFCKTAFVNSRSLPPALGASFKMIFVIFLLATFFSMSLMDMPCCQTMALGYFTCQITQDNNEPVYS